MESDTNVAERQDDPRRIPDEYLDDATAALHPIAVQERLWDCGVYPPGHRYAPKKKPWETVARQAMPSTYDWRYPRGSEENKRGVTAAQRVGGILDMLGRQYADAGMMVGYLVRAPNGRWLARQPRVNKPGVAWLEAHGYSVWFSTLCLDIDNKPHLPWSDEFRAIYDAVIASDPPLLRTAGIYFTESGWHVVQPLAELVPIARAEEVTTAYLAAAHAQGIDADKRCWDWTRVMRMPKTQRFHKLTGARYRSDFDADTSRMVPIDHAPYYGVPRASPAKKQRDPKPPKSTKVRPAKASDAAADALKDGDEADAEDEAPAPRARKERPPPPVRTSSIVYTDQLPTWWTTPIETVAKAIRLHTVEGYHAMYRDIAGAVANAEVPYELVPEIVRRIAVAAGSIKPDHHAETARQTCERRAGGNRVQGMGARDDSGERKGGLLATHIATAEAVQHALEAAEAGRLYAAAQAVPIPPLAEARGSLLQAFVGAGMTEGVTVITSECGTGKSFQAAEAARMRAELAKPGARRASAGTKTALSFDKNKLAEQWTRHLAAPDGVAVQRFRSPLSVKESDGTPTCKLHEAASLLQHGGQSVHWEVCEGRRSAPCPHKSGCRAYGLVEGEEESLIATGSHALLGRLAEFAGGTGLVVIDEPPELLETEAVTPTELRAALADGGFFTERYAVAMQPAVQALVLWMVDAPLYDEDDTGDGAVPLLDALTTGAVGVDTQDLAKACAMAGVPDEGSAIERIVACVRAALLPDAKGTAPPMRQQTGLRARLSPQLAARVGNASRVYKLLYEALAKRAGDPVLRQVARVVRRKTPDGLRRTLLVTGAKDDLVRVLRRRGPTVLSDANADLQLPVLAAMLGTPDRPFEPRVVRVVAQDAVAVYRAIAPVKVANRRQLLHNGEPVWDAGIATLLRGVVAWMNHDKEARSTCLITYKILAIAMRAAISPESTLIAEEWAKAGHSPESLAEARAVLGPILTAWRGTWTLGHYGGLRGMNNAIGCDTFVTLCDPRSNFDEVRNELAFCGLAPRIALADRVNAKAAAELEQAHGRARDVSRTTPCRHLHVGVVRPGGTAWLSPTVKVLELPRERIATVGAMTGAELLAEREAMGLTQQELADLLGVNRKTVERNEAKVGEIAAPFAHKVRELWKDR